jgi:hypothetical protein
LELGNGFFRGGSTIQRRLVDRERCWILLTTLRVAGATRTLGEYPDKEPEINVTIAAGFVHKDGVLLCGDALMEDDYSKEHGWKILTLEGAWGTGRVAFSGTVDYAISAIQKIDRKLKKTRPSVLLEKLEDYFKEEYAKHVLIHPLCGEESGPDYDLLFAMRPQKQNARLYVTSGTTLHEVTRFRCIGIGESLATYLLRPYLLGNMREEQVVCLSAYAMGAVKRAIRGCGGLSL